MFDVIMLVMLAFIISILYINSLLVLPLPPPPPSWLFNISKHLGILNFVCLIESVYYCIYVLEVSSMNVKLVIYLMFLCVLQFTGTTKSLHLGHRWASLSRPFRWGRVSQSCGCHTSVMNNRPHLVVYFLFFRFVFSIPLQNTDLISLL